MAGPLPLATTGRGLDCRGPYPGEGTRVRGYPPPQGRKTGDGRTTCHGRVQGQGQKECLVPARQVPNAQLHQHFVLSAVQGGHMMAGVQHLHPKQHLEMQRRDEGTSADAWACRPHSPPCPHRPPRSVRGGVPFPHALHAHGPLHGGWGGMERRPPRTARGDAPTRCRAHGPASDAEWSGVDWWQPLVAGAAGTMVTLWNRPRQEQGALEGRW